MYTFYELINWISTTIVLLFFYYQTDKYLKQLNKQNETKTSDFERFQKKKKIHIVFNKKNG